MLCSGPNLDDDDEVEDIENQPASHVNGDSQPKTAQQKSGEALLRHILNSDFVDGSSFSFRYVVPKFAASFHDNNNLFIRLFLRTKSSYKNQIKNTKA